MTGRQVVTGNVANLCSVPRAACFLYFWLGQWNDEFLIPEFLKCFSTGRYLRLSCCLTAGTIHCLMTFRLYPRRKKYARF